MGRRLTQEEFVKRANEVHNNKFDYSQVKYINSYVKIKIICPIHGEFLQTPVCHVWKGIGCSACSGKKRLTTQQFIDESKVKHNNKYDYSLVKYISNNHKVKIICPIHGEFSKRPHIHRKGQGCSKCGIQARGKKSRLSLEEFLIKARSFHGNRYDYSLVEYIGNKQKVKIICKIHGVFKQTPCCHANKGNGCSICSNKKRHTKEQFVKKAIEIHGNKYNYDKVVYISKVTKVEIVCDCGNIFWQKAKVHIRGSGCPICALSRGELAVTKWLNNHSINYQAQKNFGDCINPKTNYNLRFDFYLPDHNLCIEFDGEQHVRQWGHFESVENQKFRDNIKTNYCKENNIYLLRISHTELRKVNEILDLHIEIL